MSRRITDGNRPPHQDESEENVSEGEENPNQEIKIKGILKLRSVQLRQIFRHITEDDPEGNADGKPKVIRIGAVGTAMQRCVEVYDNYLSKWTNLVKMETSLMRTPDGAKPHIRYHFTRDFTKELQLPKRLIPRSSLFMSKPFAHAFDVPGDHMDELCATVVCGDTSLQIPAVLEPFFREVDCSITALKTAHDILWAKCTDAPGRVQILDQATIDRGGLQAAGMTFGAARKTDIEHLYHAPQGENAGHAGKISCAFLTSFHPDRRVNKCAGNAMMLYVVEPKYETGMRKGQFLNLVRQTAKNLIVTINQFNLRTKTNTRQPSSGNYNSAGSGGGARGRHITKIRVPFIGGGAENRHPECTDREIAKALLEGLVLNPSGRAHCTPAVVFDYVEDPGDPMHGLFQNVCDNLFDPEVGSFEEEWGLQSQQLVTDRASAP